MSIEQVINPEYHQVWPEIKNASPKTLHSARFTFKYEGSIYSFTNKKNSSESLQTQNQSVLKKNRKVSFKKRQTSRQKKLLHKEDTKSHDNYVSQRQWNNAPIKRHRGGKID